MRSTPAPIGSFRAASARETFLLHTDCLARWTRAGLLGGSILAALLWALAAGSAHAQCASAPNPIVCENALPGTTDWRIDGPISTDAGRQIQGYASATSVDTGETIDFHVTVAGGASWDLEVYRMGWYGGDGGRLIHTASGRTGVDQPGCTNPADVNSSYVCSWPVSPGGYTLAVDPTWTTGIYLAKLETDSTGHQAYILFVVREDDRTGDYYYEQAVMNYQAYNRYPGSDVSFYSGGSGVEPWEKTLSFDRPYGSFLFLRNNQSPFGALGDGSGGFFTWDFPMIQWLEEEGYDVSYATNVDLHLNPDRVLDFPAMISVGHDEYWTDEMAVTAARARDAGVDLAFFSGNHVFGTVSYDAVNRTMTGITKAGGPGVSGSWWDHPDYPDKKKRQALLGQANTGCCVRKPATYYNLDWIVADPTHWAFEGTGFQAGDFVPGLLGYEPDATDPAFEGPCSTNATALSASPFDPVAAGAASNADTSYLNSWPLPEAHTTIYQAPSGAWVFSAGTTDWPWGLATPFSAGASPPFQAASGDPQTQGFSFEQNGSGSGAIVSDAGQPAWRVDGSGGLANARRVPDGSEAWGLEEGYTLASEIRVASGGVIVSYYASGAHRFLPILSLDGSGNLDVALEGGPTLQDVATGAAATDYHTHTVSYDPIAGTASYAFDGNIMASDWTGASTSQRGLYFGQGSSGTPGIGYFRSVTLTPNATMAPDARIERTTRNVLDAFGAPAEITRPIAYDARACDPPLVAAADATGTPSRIGWTPTPTGAGNGSLATDSIDGSPAPVWHASGLGGRATWDWIPSAALEAYVAQNGWRIESQLRVLGGNYITDYYADGARRFLPILRRETNGDLAVQLEGGGDHVLATGGAADDYHTQVVLFNPLTQTANYYFDGALIETWGGSATAQRQITFGQGSTAIDGEAYYRSMTFQPAPEPGIGASIAVSLALLSQLADRRRRSSLPRESHANRPSLFAPGRDIRHL